MDYSAEKYYHLSPNVYSFNNPVRFLDPDGNDPREGGVELDINPNGAYSLSNGNFRVVQMGEVTSRVNDLNLFNKLRWASTRDQLPEFAMLVLQKTRLTGAFRTFGEIGNPTDDLRDNLTGPLGHNAEFVNASKANYYKYEDLVTDENDNPTQLIIRIVRNLGEGFEAEVTYKETINLDNPEKNTIEGYRLVKKEDDEGNESYYYDHSVTNMQGEVKHEYIPVEKRPENAEQ